MRDPRSWLRLWFSFNEPVGRRDYVLSGVVLALIKYLGDILLVRGATGGLWLPTDYVSPVHVLLSAKLANAPAALLPLLVVWTLPFLWIGVSMSMRRALDGGLSPWVALLFFVPFVSYVFIATMCLRPSHPRTTAVAENRAAEMDLRAALRAIAGGAALGLGMLVFSVYGLRSYGVSLFLGTPFVIGVVTALLFNRPSPRSEPATLAVVAATLACIAGATLIMAAEGAVCLFMAFPLALALGIMGGLIGRSVAIHTRRPTFSALIVALLPASAVLGADRAPTPLREVRSAVIIDAPPAIVWRNVIAFPPLPEPTDLVFRIGIAYPRRARIAGAGVGAVRFCVFSTGAFVEPITAWEPGRRLSFDVTSQPPPMHEWSPYADISPPHLDGYFRSRRGEFRLQALPDGRTRLEGSTWYEMRLYPGPYWAIFGDALIARIHARVLGHIRAVAEAESKRPLARN
jgi:uncharacterized membrane protein YhaH (DUF805 family)